MAASNVKSIATEYNGIVFRSMLEAKHAVFMDAIGVSWMYEPKWFTCSRTGRHYLPDFYLPDLCCFIEIKPFLPSGSDIDRSFIAAKESDERMKILWGRPRNPVILNDYYLNKNEFWPHSSGGMSLIISHLNDRELERMPVYWAKCPACGKIDIVYFAATELLDCCKNNPGIDLISIDDGTFAAAANDAKRFGRKQITLPKKQYTVTLFS